MKKLNVIILCALAVVLIVNTVLIGVLFSYVRVDRKYKDLKCNFTQDTPGMPTYTIVGIVDIPGDMVRVYTGTATHGVTARDVQEDCFWIFFGNSEDEVFTYDKVKKGEADRYMDELKKQEKDNK